MERKSEFRLSRIMSQEKLKEALQGGLIQLYQEVFAEPPYLEQFGDEEIRVVFTKYVAKGVLFLAYLDDQVVGFGAAMPLSESSICHMQEVIECDPDRTWYMADLGVRKDVRRCGLARRLVEARLDFLEPGTYVIMRTTQGNLLSRSLYSSLGFQLMPVTQDVSQERQDGTVQADARIFMSKRL